MAVTASSVKSRSSSTQVPARTLELCPRAQQPLDTGHRRALLIAATLVGLIKMIEFLLDRQVLFDFDSGGFLMNGLGTGFFSFRSHTYGGLIRLVALPFHTLTPVVALQAAMGGLTAWLLAYALVRNLRVRPWIAIAAAVAFALDPVQILHEHYILSETTTLLAAALFLVAALEYLDQRRLFQLIELSFLAALVVSLRIVYLPLVLVASILVPILAWFPTRTQPVRFRPLALALLVSCTSTYIFQTGYRHLTGWIAEREPAYEYEAGSFLLAAVSPAVRANEIDDPRLARAFEAQRNSRFPLSPDYREYQMWNQEGLIPRISTALGGNGIAMNAAAAKLSRKTILHHPLSFLMLGWYNYREYWKALPSLRRRLLWEQTTPMVIADQVDRIFPVFSQYRTNYDNPNTLSRRYVFWAHNWYAFLLASPIILCLALLTKLTNLTAQRTRMSAPRQGKESDVLCGAPLTPRPLCASSLRGVILLLVWAALLQTVTCLLATYQTPRYLHPFSFTSFAGAAVLCDALICRLRKPRELVHAR